MSKIPEEESFESSSADVEDVKELRRIYAEFLARKDSEIAELKKENEILLRTALKKKQEKMI